jgi:hypothetical protein
MKSEDTKRNASSSLNPPGRRVATPPRTSPSGGDSVGLRVETCGKRARLARETGHTALPVTPAVAPAPGAGTKPPPFPVVDAGAAESPPLRPQLFSAFGSLRQFQDAHRMATLLAHSSLVPQSYRGGEHVGDCLIALEIANRIGAAVLAVMQNLQMIHGRPAWSSQFLISCVNASKRFSPLRYQMTGPRGTDNWGCLAWAFDPSGERLESPEVTLKMARQEGWYYRIGSKWRTLPELMLRYRSATLFTRLYAPELTMGIQTTEEVAELSGEGNGPSIRPIFESELLQPELAPSPDSKTDPPVNDQENSPAQPTAAERSRRTTPRPEVAASREAPSPKLSVPAPHSAAGHYHYLKALTGLIDLSPHSEADVLNFLRQAHRCHESLGSLAGVAGKQPDAIVWTHDHWNSVDQELSRLRKDQTP